MHKCNKNTEALLVASKICLGVNAEKTNAKVMSFEQNIEQGQNRKLGNKPVVNEANFGYSERVLTTEICIH